MLHKIKLITDPDNIHYAKVFLDDFEVQGVQGVKVNMHIEEASTVTLELVGRIETETLKKSGANGR